MRILIVDDYLELPQAMAHTLRDKGHEVETACNGVQGLAKFDRAEVPFDAVVSDWNMPGMNGFRMVTEILKLNPKVKIVMMSGDDSNRPPERTPPITLLSKPFGMDELLQELEKPTT